MPARPPGEDAGPLKRVLGGRPASGGLPILPIFADAFDVDLCPADLAARRVLVRLFAGVCCPAPKRDRGTSLTGRRGPQWKKHFCAPEAIMLLLGIILLVVGFVTGISILWTIGIILAVIGAVLWIMGSMGHAVAGRRHYW
ncbi:hypothetical protein JRC61_40100 [Streptomyces sp. CL12-4]|nr:hypothetical protein [Streptomyces sp. CL12-4]